MRNLLKIKDLIKTDYSRGSYLPKFLEANGRAV